MSNETVARFDQALALNTPDAMRYRPVMIRVPLELYTQLAARARREQRSAANMVLVLVTQALKEAAPPASPASPPHSSE